MKGNNGMTGAVLMDHQMESRFLNSLKWAVSSIHDNYFIKPVPEY
jgi:hypothetical protein